MWKGMPFLFLPDSFSKADTRSVRGHRGSCCPAEKLSGLEEVGPGGSDQALGFYTQKKWQRQGHQGLACPQDQG